MLGLRAQADEWRVHVLDAIVAEHILGWRCHTPLMTCHRMIRTVCPRPSPLLLSSRRIQLGRGSWMRLPCGQARSDGIGTALLREVVAMAEQAGYPALTIQVFSQNVDALRLYERFGFEICAQTPVRQHPCQPYYTGDVLVLRKRISKSLAA